MKFSFFFLLVISIYPVWAQDSTKHIAVQSVTLSDPFFLQQPVLSDSTNIFGNKYDTKHILKTRVSYDRMKRYDKIVQADSTGYIKAGNEASQTSLYFFNFMVTATGFTKANLKITSPQAFELYIDGDKVTDKQSTQKDIAKALSASWNWKLEPRCYEVTVKCLSQDNNPGQPAVKIMFEGDQDNLDKLQVSALQSKRPFTLYDVLEGERPVRVEVSPDGKYALLWSAIVLPKGKRSSNVCLVNATSGKVLFTDNSNRNWGWMPRGSRLYYTTPGRQGQKLIVTDVTTLQENIIAEDLPEGSFRWSPDEKYLIFSITDRTTEEKSSGVKQILTPRDRQPGWRNRAFLYRYDLSTGVLQPLVFGYRTASLLDISPDSRYLVFLTHKDDYTQRPFMTHSMYRLDLVTMKVDTLWSDIRYGKATCFSPDGKQLLLLGGPESFDNIGRSSNVKSIPNSYDQQAYIYSFQDKKIRSISLDFNPSIESAWWSAVDNNIYFRVVDEDYVNMYRYHTRKEKFEKVPLPVDVLQSISIARESMAAVGIGQSVSYASTTFRIDLKNDKVNQLSDPMKATMDKLELGKVQNWTFRSSEGADIKGRVYYPHDFDPGHKYPLIVYYYGGTTPVNRAFDSRYPFHVYASMGYVVYVLQPSGAIGFGQEFSAQHVNAWGERTADDIIEGTKQFCDTHSFINRNKIGCMGASYGGFMTMYLQTKTDIFAAAVSHAGISDITSYWGEGYWGYSYNAAAAADSYPWNNRDLFVGQSPLFSADKIKTPILLLHGDADTNVPVGESIQMYTALKILGKPVELITVDGENHHILDYHKRIRWNNSIFAWFSKWLKDDQAWWNELYPEKNL